MSGTPKLFRPLVIGAKTAARIRNEYWLAKATSDEWKEIRGAKATPTFHPVKSDNINDFAPRDHDNNFGRIARSGVWTQKIAQLVEEERIAGIPLLGWQTFLGAFKETSTLEKSVQAIQAYLSKSEIGETSQTEEAFSKIAEGMSSLFDILSSAPAVVAKTAKRPKKL